MKLRRVEEIITEAESLSVEERLLLVDSLLRNLNGADDAVEKEWLAVAKSRLAELRAGRVTAIPGDEVFSRVRERFQK